MKRSALISLFGLLALAVGLTGCKSGESRTGPEASDKSGKSLYERLGGEPAITLVVDDFVDRTAANPKVNVTRKGEGREWQATPENVRKLKRLVVEFVCSVTGGPQKYTGRDMVTTHRGMNITEAQFNAAGDDLVASLKKFNVSKKEQDELMAIVGTTKKEIVGK